MNLNQDKTEIYCHHCLTWHIIETETLWIPQDNGVIKILCLKAYPEYYILLGYDHDL